MFRSVCLGDYTNTFVDHIIDIFEVKEDLVEEDTEVVVMEDVKPCSSDVTVVPMTSESSSSSEDVAVASMSENSTAGDIDFDALKSLSDEGIDMSFLGSLQARLVATQPTTSSSSSSASSTADQPSVLRYITQSKYCVLYLLIDNFIHKVFLINLAVQLVEL